MGIYVLRKKKEKKCGRKGNTNDHIMTHIISHELYLFMDNSWAFMGIYVLRKKKKKTRMTI